MNWNYVETNWHELKAKVKQNWDKISDQQLDAVAGKRDRLCRVIQRVYAINSQQAEEQITEWQDAQVLIDGHFYTANPAIYKSFKQL
jgi:uncharacterized protein YjbJ (UPF0337 family)